MKSQKRPPAQPHRHTGLILLGSIVFLVAILGLRTLLVKPHDAKYFVAGTGNPGTIYLYSATGKEYELTKKIPTDFAYVHTVRIGDIYNDGTTVIVAGVSNSPKDKPFDCQVVAYNLDGFVRGILDQTNDLRCKDLAIGDADNDGKNEIVATLSSPLELANVEEVSFVRMYKKENGTWNGSTIDETSGREFRSIAIGDPFGTAKNSVIIGLGSPRMEPGSLVSYTFNGSSWDKTAIHNDTKERNMKGVALARNTGNVRPIILATGFPDARIMSFVWDGGALRSTNITSLRSHIDKPGAEFNAMAVILPNKTDARFVVGGMTVYPEQKIGWEQTREGFLMDAKRDGNTWKTRMLLTGNVLSLDSQ